MSPRVFLIASHQTEDPERVVARLIMENLYLSGSSGSARQGKVLDPRGMFLVQTVDKVYLWVGSEVASANLPCYKKCVDHFMSLLHKHERAAKELIVL